MIQHVGPIKMGIPQQFRQNKELFLLIEKPFHGLVTPESFQGLNLAHFHIWIPSVSAYGGCLCGAWVIKISTYIFTPDQDKNMVHYYCLK